MGRIVKIFVYFLLLLPFSAVASEDIKCLASNIYFESRGESLAGQLAVAHVTVNRVLSPKFPNTVCDVVYQAKYHELFPLRNKCQFSWFCDGIKEDITDIEAYEKAKDIATYVLTAGSLDITDGALYYHARTVSPYWNKHMNHTLTIGNHIFYK